MQCMFNQKVKCAGCIFQILEHAIDPKIIINKWQEVLLFNSAAAELFEIDQEEMIGQPLTKLFDADMAEKHRFSVENFFTGKSCFCMGRTVRLNYKTRKTKQELLLELSLSYHNLHDQGLVLAIIRNVTERENQRALLERALEGMNSGFAVLDTELRYQRFNKFMEEYTGLSEKEVLGKKSYEIFPHLIETGVYKAFLRVLKGETVNVPKAKFLRDGVLKYFRGS